jgi:hypothetical protein
MKMDLETKWVFDDAERTAEELAVWIKEVRQQAELALNFHEMPSLSDAAIAKGRRCASVVETLQDELHGCCIRMQQCMDAVSDSIDIQRKEGADNEATETN